ncbi:MAG TPA: FAD-dependent oxidoreductase [Membranihabitans sp.]|nr:FAD-dependent oxidoreductase [Membranihabitans sp.]
MQKIVIIGNGISGITAARHIRKRSNHEILVISKETDHFFSRTALMYIYMGHMRFEDTKPYEDWFWEKNRINLRKGEVTRIDFDSRSLTIELRNDDGSLSEEEIAYDRLIMATGSRTRKFGWPGQDLKNVQGLYSYQDLLSLESVSSRIDHAVIVGGGLIGIELAEMLHSRNKKVSILVREENYWDNVLPPDEARMINDQIRRNHINLHLLTDLEEIIGDDHGRVSGVRTKDGNEIPCQFVGLTAGVQPNIGWLDPNSPLETDIGILVDSFLKTNLDDVYAIGDCAQLRHPPSGHQAIEAVWYTGRIMGETVAHTLTGHPVRYEPGPWFNSAKFINLEYQTYGVVPNRILPPYDSIYWQHDQKEVALRLVFHEDDRRITGINALGLRLSMDVCLDWIQNQVPVEQVVASLQDAHFDAEFSSRFYSRMNAHFSQTLNQSR